MIKTTIIIPVYNTSKYLEECIESVFYQTQNEVEVIAINDGSTDDSLEILYQLQKKYPELIVVDQENRGLGATRNVGMEMAKGEYILFLDSDDYILRSTLEECYREATESKLDIVMFDAFKFYDTDEREETENNNYDRKNIIKEREEVFSGKDFWNKYYPKTYVSSACLMYYSKRFLTNHNITFLPKVYYEDNEFHCRVMMLARRIKYIPKMFYRRRCRLGSVMYSDFSERKANDLVTVVDAICALKMINQGQCWNTLKKIAQMLLCYTVNESIKSDKFQMDNQLLKRIYTMALKTCGGRLQNVDETGIAFLNRLFNLLPHNGFIEERQYIKHRRDEFLKNAFETLPLQNKNVNIAIYGCGKYTDFIFEQFNHLVGSIQAHITFLDSYVSDNLKTYRGYIVQNVNYVDLENYDCIIISSSLYETEMLEKLSERGYSKNKIILLFGGLHIEM